MAIPATLFGQNGSCLHPHEGTFFNAAIIKITSIIIPEPKRYLID